MRKQLILHYIKRSRNNVIVFGIAISVMMIFSLVQIGESIAMRYKSMLLQSFVYDISSVSMSQDEYDKVEEFAAGRGFKVVWEDNICSVDVNEYGVSEGLLLARKSDSNLLEIQSGSMVEKPFDLIISSGFSKENEIEIGQQLSLPMCFEDDEIVEYSFTVTGIFKDVSGVEDLLVFYTSPATTEVFRNEGKETIENAVCAYFTLDENDFEKDYLLYVREEICNVIEPDYFNLVIKDSELLSQEEIERLDEVKKNVSLNMIKDEVYQTMSEDKTVFYSILGIAIILAFATFLLIFNMIHLDSIRRIKDFSVARCLGFNGNHLKILLSCEIMVDIVFGCGLGILTGNIMNCFIAGKIIDAIVGSKVTVVQHWSCYAITLGISITSILCANIRMIKSVLRIQPVDGLRLIDESTIASAKASKRISKKNYIFEMSLRNISRNRLKSLAVIISLVVCLSMLNAVIHTFMSVRSMNSTTLYRNEIANCEIHTLDPELEWVESKGLPSGIVKTYCYKSSNSMCCHGGEDVDIPWSGSVYVFDDALCSSLFSKTSELNDFDLSKPLLIYCNLEDYKVDEITVKGKTIVVDNGCSAVAGDTLSLSFGLNEDVFETELTAVLDGFNMDFNYSDEISNYWIVNKAFADTYGINTDFCNHILFSVEEMNSRNVSAIKEQYLTGNGSFVNFQSDKENDEKQLKGMMILALYLIVATALAGFVSMANTIKFNILTRRRENAIMRAIGLPFEIQVKTICMENLLLILAAVLVSTVLSFGLNTLITSKIIYDFQVHIFPYIFTLISAVIVSEVIAYVTVKKYGKNNLSDEIRSNE